MGLGATGLGFSENTTSTLANNLFPTEEVTVYSGQPWNWTQQPQASTLDGVVAPVPVLPSPPEASFLPMKMKQVPSPSSYERSPDPPLPTPAQAAMAVLLGSGARADERVPFDMAGGVAAAPIRDSGLGPLSVGVTNNHGLLESTSREKKHACTMCHKRFDRPSTLRKHLLVHTGEKAFVCEICGRRFGVNSNLNRHVKRCALKPVNMAISSPPKSDSPSSGEDTSDQVSPIAQSPENSFTRSPTISHKRGSISSLSSSSSSSRGRSSLSPLQPQHPVTANSGTKSTQKRRRRAPSPSRWVPLSLLSFNLVSEDMYRSVSVPLAPVRRNLPKEERDSWDENVAPTPYHPHVWKGVLPGPGLPSHHGLRNKDVSKMSYGGGTGSFMVSRLVTV
ncbi:hypothetical protein NMY22_g15411 [Coprinellus aureogranulatus]|nr:hypothetical protein NMY22_g15411 [Coprinellus aureogranulatus]